MLLFDIARWYQWIVREFLGTIKGFLKAFYSLKQVSGNFWGAPWCHSRILNILILHHLFCSLR